MSHEEAERLPTWQFTLLWVCAGLLGAVTTGAISILTFGLSRTGPFDIQHLLTWWIGYTIFSTGFALLVRHMRLRRRQKQDQPGAWGRFGQ